MSKTTTCLFALAAAMLLTGCQSPLIRAAWRGDPAQVQQLLDKGADINAESFCSTPLMTAARAGNTQVVELLLGKGANINATDTCGGRYHTALIMAAQQGQTDCVKVLLEHGANTEQRDCWGKSASDYATDKGYPEIVKLIRAASPKGTSKETAQPSMLPINNTGNEPF